MRFFGRLLTPLAAMALALLLTACAGPAPNYAPSIDNVEALKKSGALPVKTGAIAVDPTLKSGAAIGLRANTMVSGVGQHFGDYIAAALRQELELARLHDPKSGIEVSGTLLRNDINAGGMSTNDGMIAVRFLVRQGTQTRFDKIKEARHQWESSFVGAVAIPTAANNYPVMVQMLFGQLFADPDFTAALRP